jgi:hypothetical protein
MAKPTAILPLKLQYEPIRFLLYGYPGTGKTPFLATGPRTLILDGDGGTVSAAIAGGAQGVEVWPRIRRHEQLIDAYEYLRHGGTDDFNWVWLDGITLFQEWGLQQIMEELVARASHRQLWLPDRQEYRSNMGRIKLWIRDMYDLPINFGITAHVAEYTDRQGDTRRWPQIHGVGMPEYVAGFMNMVGLMKRDPEPKIQFALDDDNYGKDRFSAVAGGVLENPSIPKLEELVRRKLPKATTGAAPVRKGTAKKVTPTKKVTKKAVPVKKATKKTARR